MDAETKRATLEAMERMIVLVALEWYESGHGDGNDLYTLLETIRVYQKLRKERTRGRKQS